MSTLTGIEVLVNDRPTQVEAGASLHSVLAGLGWDAKKGVAAAVNGAVVPRSVWASRSLQAGDKLLVIQATQGG
jgi:sulfur carrier protein